MSKDDKELLKCLVTIFAAVLLSYQLPHDSYSIIQFIIRPIRVGSGTIYLAGCIPLVMIIISIKRLFKLKRFAETSKLLLIIVVLILVLPIMRSSLDVVKATYFWVMNDELRTIDIVDTEIKFSGISNNEATLNVKLELIDYGRSKSKFKVRLYLPESLKENLSVESVMFDEWYSIMGNRGSLNIEKDFLFQLEDGRIAENIFKSRWHEEKFMFELYNDVDSIEIIHRD